jgi:hypothetical protein
VLRCLEGFLNILHREDLYLINAADFDTTSLSSLSALEIKAFELILDWCKAYLCKPNSKLGREGPVCPFTQPSLKKRLFWLTIHRGSSGRSASQIARYRDWFLELDPRSGPEAMLKTILILHPEIASSDAAGILDPVQKELKPNFVKKGLMIGQFYEGCTEPGLWSDAFFPLQAPIPLLAIRNMVPSDFPFLYSSRGNAQMLISYLNRFGTNIPPEVKKLMVDALEKSESKLQPKRAVSRNARKLQ